MLGLLNFNGALNILASFYPIGSACLCLVKLVKLEKALLEGRAINSVCVPRQLVGAVKWQHVIRPGPSKKHNISPSGNIKYINRSLFSALNIPT